jgi:hypothetical protein
VATADQRFFIVCLDDDFKTDAFTQDDLLDRVSLEMARHNRSAHGRTTPGDRFAVRAAAAAAELGR